MRARPPPSPAPTVGGAPPGRAARWRAPLRDRLALGLLALYAAAFCLRSAVFVPGTFAAAIVSNLFPLPLAAAAVSFAWQAARQTAPSRLRTAWLWLASSFATFFLGDALFLAMKIARHGALVGASVADAAYLLSYPIAFVGLAAMRSRRPGAGGRAAFLLDESIVALGAAMVAWHAFVTPALQQPAYTVEGIVALAYVVGDSVLLLGLILAGAAPSLAPSRRPFALLVAALALRLGANALFWYDVLNSHRGSPLASDLYVLGWLAVAAAAVAQARVDVIGRPAPRAGASRFSPVPYLSAGVGYAVLLHVVGERLSLDVAGLVLGGIALTVAVLSRQLIGERARARLEAERVEQATEARYRSLVAERLRHRPRRRGGRHGRIPLALRRPARRHGGPAPRRPGAARDRAPARTGPSWTSSWRRPSRSRARPRPPSGA